MKILLLSKYSRKGASSRLRSLQYLPYLEAEGIEVFPRPLFDDEYLEALYTQGRRSSFKIFWQYTKRLMVLLRCSKFDFIWIEKEMFPYFPAFGERLVSLLGKPYVVDYDDAVFHNYDLSGNPAVRLILGKKIDVVMRKSSLVMAGNSYLARRANLAGASEVVVIPTVVDTERYSSKPVVSGAPLIIGWIGSPSTEHYIVNLCAVLSAIYDRFGTKLLLVGARPEIVDSLPGCNVEVAPWSEETEVEQICKMDIGIMPLSDGPWENGKCGYKLIQYMACGVPVIASSVGVNAEIVNASESGLLADDDEGWSEALGMLLVSEQKRSAFGAQGRKAVMSTYSLDVQGASLRDALLSIQVLTR